MNKSSPLLGIYARGLAMGAADIVPGVSGGTIALITGIYDRLIDSLKAMGSRETLAEMSRFAWRSFIQRTDCVFLMVLFAGILSSILGLATVITYLLKHHPQPLWSFFLGLVLASAVVIGKDLRNTYHLNAKAAVPFFAGAILALLAGRLTPTEFTVEFWHYFAGGAIAICAMILPGVSGSFLLLMLGLYAPVLKAVQSFDILPLMIFASGCGLGLLTFSHVLSWCLHKYPAPSHLFLVGLMIGAVEKLWPWKETLSTRVKSDGTLVPLLERAVSPWAYESLVGSSASLGLSCFSFGCAFLCILVLGKRNVNA